MDDVAKKLVDEIWPTSSRKPLPVNRDEGKTLSFEAYYDYYKWQSIHMAPRAGTPNFAAYSPTNIISLVQLLQTDPDREAALSQVKSKMTVPNNEECDILVNLAARLLLMLRFGITRQQKALQQASSPSHLDWNSGTLSAFVGDCFAPPTLNHESIRLPKLFNAWSISAVAGIEIDFTDNLADHLLLVEEHSKVLIFHHASFLELQQRHSPTGKQLKTWK